MLNKLTCWPVSRPDGKMRKEYEVNGKTIIVENGTLTVNGNKVCDHVYNYQIREIKDAPKFIRDHVAKNKLDMTGKVYVDCKTGLTINREIAEEAARQTEENRKATDPNNVIEGYTEIKAAYADVARYFRDLEKSYETSIGPNPIAVQPEDVEKKYPKAAAYVEAEKYSKADNYDKANAGKKAMERIVAGENYETVIAEMKAEWLADAEKAVLNN